MNTIYIKDFLRSADFPFSSELNPESPAVGSYVTIRGDDAIIQDDVIGSSCRAGG